MDPSRRRSAISHNIASNPDDTLWTRHRRVNEKQKNANWEVCIDGSSGCARNATTKYR
jgi:hypothetical protein